MVVAPRRPVGQIARMLVIDDVTLRVAGKLLLEGASARIPDGARVGLVGRNGVGKTTLFRAIAGDMPIEHGEIALPARARIGRLAQEAPDGPESLIEVVLKADPERNALLAEAETATDPHRIAEIQTRLADIGAHSAPARAAEILSGLGFSHEDQQRPCAEFSGGWRMRVALAATLFAEPDLLLLDEPTNYLDLEGTLWLEEHIYRGDYSSFERQRRERQALDLKLAKAQEAQRKKLQAFVDRFRAKATKARQAQSRLKLLAKLEPITARVADEVREFDFAVPEKALSPPIVALDDVAVGYEEDHPVLRRLALSIDTDDRIALLGANGNGKSTFVKLIAGRLAPMRGTLTRAERLKVAYFAQHQLDELDPAASAYLHLRRLMPDAAEPRVRARAGAIGFSGEMADTAVGKLSGGEKSRLLLGLATFEGAHLLILDEPTNHLDIDSRAALIEAINSHPGAVILVSHDRYLIEACADRLWLVANGAVTPFDGDLDEYRRFVLSDRGGDATARKQSSEMGPRASRAELRRAAAEKRIELTPLRRRLTEAEKTIARLTAEITRIDSALAAPDLYAREPEKAATLSKARADAADALARAEDEWLTVSTEIETAMA
jgi:ATP-binding cassette subfamily F protein 3